MFLLNLTFRYILIIGHRQACRPIVDPTIVCYVIFMVYSCLSFDCFAFFYQIVEINLN